MDVAVIGGDTLEATSDMEGFVIDIILEGFKLATGVDSLAFTHVSILMHDGNNRAALGGDNTTNGDNGSPRPPHTRQ